MQEKLATGKGGEFKTRFTGDYNPARKTGIQDYQFPKELSFENQFVGFQLHLD